MERAAPARPEGCRQRGRCSRELWLHKPAGRAGPAALQRRQPSWAVLAAARVSVQASRHARVLLCANRWGLWGPETHPVDVSLGGFTAAAPGPSHARRMCCRSALHAMWCDLCGRQLRVIAPVIACCIIVRDSRPIVRDGSSDPSNIAHYGTIATFVLLCPNYAVAAFLNGSEHCGAALGWCWVQ